MKKPLRPSLALAPNPSSVPKHAVKFLDAQGKEVTLADPRAVRSLVLLMDQHAVNGGAACHWGGAAALTEITVSLHALMFAKNPWHQYFNFVNDAGHTENGLYAIRTLYGFDGLNYEALKEFRGLGSKLTGHGESHLNPEGVLLSNGPLGSSLPQAQGLAMADKLTGNERTTICIVSDGAAMEGEAKEAFSAIPGLASQNKLNPFVLIISDNNTKLTGRIDAGAYPLNPSLTALATMGWKVIKLNQAHDLKSAYNILDEALGEARKNPQTPICIWAKTIKGKGLKETEESATGGHGFPLKKHDLKLLSFLTEIYGNELPLEYAEWEKSLRPTSEAKTTSGAKTEKAQEGISKALIEMREQGYPVVSISADLQGSTGVAGFHKKFPEAFFDLGVAEANMVSSAAGFSKAGFIPVVDTFAQFGITKGNLPLIMANLSQAPVIAIFSHTGFQDAADGASHQATTYFSAVSSIPMTEVISCSNSSEAYHYLKMAIEEQYKAKEKHQAKSYIFFLGRENFPFEWAPGLSYEWKKAQVLTHGKNATLVTTGPLVTEALSAAQTLALKGITLTVINSSFINAPDVATIAAELAQTQNHLITLEDHQVIGGMGSLLTHKLLIEKGVDLKVTSLGIPGVFGQSAYVASHLYRKYNLAGEGLVREIEKALA